MRILIPFFLLFFFVAPVSEASTYKLSELRKLYLEASKSSEASKRFYKHMSNYKENDPVVLAYKAVAEASMAKHVWSPYHKMKHLKAATGIFDKAIVQDKDNAEIRFLRFTVEHYVPRYLNMSTHLEEDKKYIINSLRAHPNSGFTTEWARTMHQFMLAKDHSTEAEKKILRSLNI